MRYPALVLVAAVLASSCSSHCVRSKADAADSEGFGITPAEPVVLRGRTMEVFRIGEGPPVILLHEVTGLSPESLRLGRLIASSGFSVYMPLLFGGLGDSRFVVNTIRACTGGLFHCFDRDRSNDPALVESLLLLARRVSAEQGGAPVGVVGMCLTGNTGIELVGGCSPVRAIVASQPALPFAAPGALGVSDRVIQSVKAHPVPVLAFRFTEDGRSPAKRMDRWETTLGARLTRRDINSGPGPENPFRIRRDAHSVLTGDFLDVPGHPTRQALDEVIDLFRRTLATGAIELDCAPGTATAGSPGPAPAR